MSKLFTGYEYWVYRFPQWKSSYKEFEYWNKVPANEKVTRLRLRMIRIILTAACLRYEKAGLWMVRLSGEGQLLYAYLLFGGRGAPGRDLYTRRTPDDSTLALITADQRGVPFKGQDPNAANLRRFRTFPEA